MLRCPQLAKRYRHGFWLSLLLGCAAILTTGCTSYQVGVDSLYRPDIRTVHVSVFRSDALRRNLGEWLTEAVVKDIETLTPYKAVPSANADTYLSGRIISVSKRGLAENPNDELRDLEVDFYVEVRWIDRNGNVLMQHSALPIESSSMTVAASSRFVPEGGQSMTTAQQRDIRKLAKRIVGLMEITPL